jgi:anti-sigma regulatory factor (Ser/Thr protein kinase)
VAFAASLQIRNAEFADFVIAVGEAVANAIEHASTQDAIEVSAWFAGDYLFATVVDRGVGFEPAGTDAPPLPPEFVERGRGLPIMRQCSDVFTVRSAPGRGTAVTLGHRIREAAAGLRYGTG